MDPDQIKNLTSEVVTTLLSLVVTVLVPYGLALLRTWVKAKTAAIEDKTLREGVEWAFDRLDATAETVVREIEQTIKERAPNGKTVKPDNLQAVAMARTWKRLPPTASEALRQMYPEPELRNVIRGKIEAKIKPRC